MRCGRVEDGRSGLGHPASPCFPSPLIKPDVPISGIRLTWDVSLSTVQSAPHGMISSGSVQTASRFEPVCVLALPSQDKLTFGRRTRQPHHDPAYGGGSY